MQTIKILVEYDGSNYSGWQLQPDVATIQGMLEEALFQLTGERQRVEGSGRTDKGVHALGQVAHFKVMNTLRAKRFARGLNAYLPRDISVRYSEAVSPCFHSRYSTRNKLYCYEIENSCTRPAVDRHRLWWVSYPLDFSLLKQAGNIFIGTHNFTSFADAKHAVYECDNLRAISHSCWRRKGNRLSFYIRGSGFLYKMVRCMVGTMIEIGRGKLPVEELENIIAAKNCEAAGPTAPARGLCLLQVKY